MNKLTEAQVKALSILKEHSSIRTGISAKFFAEKMWRDTDTNMFTKVSNQGNRVVVLARQLRKNK